MVAANEQGQLMVLERFLMLYCFPVQLLIGLTGNGLNLLVLTNRRLRSGTNWLLAQVALADSLFLLAFLPHTLLFNHWALRDDIRLRHFLLHANIHITTGVNACAFASAWFVVAVSMERMNAVRWPLRARRLWSGKNLRRLVLAIWAFALIATGHSHFTHSIQAMARNETRQDPHTGQLLVEQRLALQSGIRPGWERLWGVFTTLSVLCGVLLPVVLVLLANLAILEPLSREQKQQQQQQQHSQFPLFDDGGSKNGANGKTTTTSSTFQTSSPATKTSTTSSSPLCFINNNNRLLSPLPSIPLFSSHASSQQQQAAHARHQRRATLCVLIIAATFTACQSPSALVHLWEVCWPSVGQRKAFRTAAVLSNFLVVTGKTANHFLLCFWSAHFRRNVRLVLAQLLPASWSNVICRCRLKSKSTTPNNNNNNNKKIVVVESEGTGTERRKRKKLMWRTTKSRRNSADMMIKNVADAAIDGNNANVAANDDDDGCLMLLRTGSLPRNAKLDEQQQPG